MEEPSSCIVPFNIGSGKRGFRTVDGALQSAVCVTLRGSTAIIPTICRCE